MATYSEILIKHSNLEEIIAMFAEHYELGERQILMENRFRYRYFSVIVLHKSSHEWIKIDIHHRRTLYDFDVIIRRITKKFQTVGMYGYKQTTDETTRFAYFENGKVIRSITFQYINDEMGIEPTEDYGEPFKFESYDFGKKEYFERDEHWLMGYYDDIQYWYRELGYENVLDDQFLHIELKKQY